MASISHALVKGYRMEVYMYRIAGLALACSLFVSAQKTTPEGASSEVSGAFGRHDAVGLVGGIARDSATGEPVAQAQIIAHNVTKGTDQTTVTDVTGIFTFTNLEPGPYEVSATKNGYQKSAAQVV